MVWYYSRPGTFLLKKTKSSSSIKSSSTESMSWFYIRAECSTFTSSPCICGRVFSCPYSQLLYFSLSQGLSLITGPRSITCSIGPKGQSQGPGYCMIPWCSLSMLGGCSMLWAVWPLSTCFLRICSERDLSSVWLRTWLLWGWARYRYSSLTLIYTHYGSQPHTSKRTSYFHKTACSFHHNTIAWTQLHPNKLLTNT